ncbi:hypothetical protein GJAV_G00157210 [Gymnothorax javanicus]|nr:hypothetical protein GJAV_G00157210 [Gymnothorax javanicus]
MKLSNQPFHIKNNLTGSERAALNEIIMDRNLVVKLADKGGGICVQDAAKYKSHIFSQLSNADIYKQLATDPACDFQQEICAYLNNASEKGWITKAEQDFLFCQHPIRPEFYTLHKICKSLSNLPSRPIVPQTNSLLAPLSEFVDFYIKPYVQA